MSKIDHYTYRVSWSEEDQEFVAACVELPSLSWLDKTPEKALRGIRTVVNDCIEHMCAKGEAIPEPLATRAFSGRFMVRVPPQLHRNLSVQAAEAGTSLNRLVSHKLAS